MAHFHDIYCLIMHKYGISIVFKALENIKISHHTGNCAMVCSVVLAAGLKSDEWTESGLTAGLCSRV